MLCGLQGITYDTGGADIKAGGVMAGMHRDKCGAAAVAGFFKVTEYLYVCINNDNVVPIFHTRLGAQSAL